jgi:hypothetical protein
LLSFSDYFNTALIFIKVGFEKEQKVSENLIFNPKRKIV